MPIAEVVQPADGVPRLRVVPATIDLAGAEIELVSLVARESRLQRAIEAYCAAEAPTSTTCSSTARRRSAC